MMPNSSLLQHKIFATNKIWSGHKWCEKVQTYRFEFGKKNSLWQWASFCTSAVGLASGLCGSGINIKQVTLLPSGDRRPSRGTSFCVCDPPPQAARQKVSWHDGLHVRASALCTTYKRWHSLQVETETILLLRVLSGGLLAHAIDCERSF